MLWSRFAQQCHLAEAWLPPASNNTCGPGTLTVAGKNQKTGQKEVLDFYGISQEEWDKK